MDRPAWHEYFMDIAIKASARSTCDRKHVGCVLVKDNQLIATGYNGSLHGTDHCDEVGHLILNGSCVRTSHAEENAIASAARLGIATKGSICFVTHFPCWRCTRLLAQAGVEQVVFNEFKINELSEDIYKAICDSKLKLTDMSGKELEQASDLIGEAKEIKKSMESDKRS